MSGKQIKLMNKYLKNAYKKMTDLRIEEMVWERIFEKMSKWEKTKKSDEIRSEFEWIAEPYIEKFAAEKELLRGSPYEIYATEKEVDVSRLQWNGYSYEYSKHRWRDKQGDFYVDEIQVLLDNLFEENLTAMSERVESAELDLVVAKFYEGKQCDLVLDDYYKNEHKNLCKKVHDENIEIIKQRVLEM